MEKRIEEYLHLYFGSDVWIPPPEEGAKADIRRITGRLLQYPMPVGTKIYLRSLSDMTDEENKQSSTIWFNEAEKQGKIDINVYAATTKYYLDKQFDIFGLIESGLAIDKTKLQKTIK